ncbi:hypothetical protein BSPWISOXPB_4446 [uncultured Gammaproteobacteria bacterium]|nr:hypothetical protein BSPWISOXPB_4446 [uncultured Gammaproteobacteria bacterium]
MELVNNEDTVVLLLVLTLSVKADFFGDIGDWFEVRRMIQATGLQRLMMILLHT